MILKPCRYALLLVATMLCCACEKAVIEEEEDTPGTIVVGANVVLNVKSNTVTPLEAQTRAVVNITEYCKTFNFVLYQGEKKVKAITQKNTDTDFGQVSMMLEPGTYQLLVLAHSSAGNPSLSDPTKLQFTNADQYSDTFYYYGELVVTDDPETHYIQLERATTAVKMVFEETVPENLCYVNVFYTGGSGVLNAVTGYGGNVNSQQEVIVDVSKKVAAKEPFAAPVYTFLQSDSCSLNMVVKAMDKNKDIIMERTYKDVPVVHTKLTQFKGRFFDPMNTFVFTAETDWEVVDTLDF